MGRRWREGGISGLEKYIRRRGGRRDRRGFRRCAFSVLVSLSFLAGKEEVRGGYSAMNEKGEYWNRW